jgi:DNA polymerase-3 subunit epsilon
MLQLNRPIICFDLETTDADPLTSRVVEICLLKVYPDGKRELKTRRLDPGIPIAPDATAVHGITNDMVKHEPRFAQIARSLSAFFAGCDLCTFNGERFDIVLLAEEFARVDIAFPEEDAVSVDVSNIYRVLNPRTLTAAVGQYLGRDHVEAHSAEADVVATFDVLECLIMEIRGEAEERGLGDAVDTSVDALAVFANRGKPVPKRVDVAGKLIENDEGEIVWNFGKYKGQRVIGTDLGFIGWVMKQDFPETTKAIIRRLTT